MWHSISRAFTLQPINAVLCSCTANYFTTPGQMPLLNWEESVTFDLKPKPLLIKVDTIRSPCRPFSLALAQKNKKLQCPRAPSPISRVILTFREPCDTHRLSLSHTDVQGAIRQTPRAICIFPQDNTAAAGVTKRQTGSWEIEEDREHHTRATIWGEFVCFFFFHVCV